MRLSSRGLGRSASFKQTLHFAVALDFLHLVKHEEIPADGRFPVMCHLDGWDALSAADCGSKLPNRFELWAIFSAMIEVEYNSMPVAGFHHSLSLPLLDEQGSFYFDHVVCNVCSWATLVFYSSYPGKASDRCQGKQWVLFSSCSGNTMSWWRNWQN